MHKVKAIGVLQLAPPGHLLRHQPYLFAEFFLSDTVKFIQNFLKILISLFFRFVDFILVGTANLWNFLFRAAATG